MNLPAPVRPARARVTRAAAALGAYAAALADLRAALDPSAGPEALRALLSEAEIYRRSIPEGLHAVPHA